MRESIIVLIKQPKAWPIIKTVPNNLKVFSGIVEGPLEIITVRNDVAIICNEEARTLSHFRRKKNFGITVDKNVIDSIYGTTIICSQEGEEFGDLGVDNLLDIFNSLCEDEPYVEVKFKK